jgi:DNA-binding response OmpR family regulator
METDSILIAETDPALLEDLRFFISSDLPWIELTVCTSLQQTVEQLSRSHYSTMIAASQMIQEEASGILLQKRKRHPLVPLVLTAGHVDREAAHDALLHRGAFDIITKPVDLTEALASIRVALWQARFLRLLTQRERRVCQFQGHLAVYPEERDRGGARGWISKRVDGTLALVRKCITVVDLHRLDALLIDLARSVEEWTYERALDRLERMRADRVWT